MELDDRRLRWLLWAALALVGLGLWFFVLRGADQPEDPRFEGDPEAGATTGPAVTGPVISATTLLPLTSTPTASFAPEEVALPGDPRRVPLAGFGELAVTVDPGDGRGLLAWCLLAATSPEQRGRGMIGVTDLQGYDGMIFVYDEPVQNAYHMRDVPLPLSIGWFAPDGRLAATADMTPCSDGPACPSYSPGASYTAAVEVPQGGLDELGIVDGSRLRITGACAPRPG